MHGHAAHIVRRIRHRSPSPLLSRKNTGKDKTRRDLFIYHLENFTKGEIRRAYIAGFARLIVNSNKCLFNLLESFRVSGEIFHFFKHPDGRTDACSSARGCCARRTPALPAGPLTHPCRRHRHRPRTFALLSSSLCDRLLSLSASLTLPLRRLCLYRSFGPCRPYRHRRKHLPPSLQ